jgi:hypothetical protein
MQATSRRIDRESQRRRRELDKREKQYAKMAALEQAAYEVEDYENRLELLVSVHKDCGESIDWHSFIEREEPRRPEPSASNEEQAVRKEQSYRPGPFARWFKMEGRQRAKLLKNIETAKEKDARENLAAHEQWASEHAGWLEEFNLASGVVAGDAKAKIEAIRVLNPFADISHLGTTITLGIGSTGLVEASLRIHGARVVPSEVKSLLQSGKLSTKKMPAGKYNELLQDYVCSCVLRVGRELMSILPDNLVVVTAVDKVLNSATGHMEELPILSVLVSRPTLEALNLDAIDPSDSMKNFVHHMSFKKTTGFAPVQVVPAVESRVKS